MFADQLLLVYVFSAGLCVLSTYAKKQWWISVIVTVKITKNRYTAIKFIDFLRFPLSIDQNHLIATDFYRLTTPGMHNNKQYFPTIDNFTRAQRGVQFYLRRNPPGN